MRSASADLMPCTSLSRYVNRGAPSWRAILGARSIARQRLARHLRQRTLSRALRRGERAAGSRNPLVACRAEEREPVAPRVLAAYSVCRRPNPSRGMHGEQPRRIANGMCGCGASRALIFWVGVGGVLPVGGGAPPYPHAAGGRQLSVLLVGGGSPPYCKAINPEP